MTQEITLLGGPEPSDSFQLEHRELVILIWAVVFFGSSV